MQNSDFWSRITSIYVTQFSSVVFAYTTAHFGPEFQVCTGPRQNLSFFAWKTATLAHELLVSMGPSPHLWFLHAKQWLLEQNYKYLCDTALICGFCIHNSAFWTGIRNLYGSQTSPVVLCMQNSVISTRITCLYGSQPLSVVFACKTVTFGAELQVSMWHSSHLWFLHIQQRILDQNFKSVRDPDKTCRFLHGKQQL